MTYFDKHWDKLEIRRHLEQINFDYITPHSVEIPLARLEIIQVHRSEACNFGAGPVISLHSRSCWLEKVGSIGIGHFKYIKT